MEDLMDVRVAKNETALLAGKGAGGLGLKI
jgi:hypothetical protein